MSAIAQPTWPIAVIARAYWLGEIGRVSYCLYLIHDAVRIGVRSVSYFHPVGRTCVYKIWSRRTKAGTVSEKSITRQQSGLVSWAENEPSALSSIGGAAWSQISCVEGRRSITMRELRVRIGNSCQNQRAPANDVK